jgi:hypothetical protein
MLAPGRLPQLQANARAIRNRAIFEVTDLLQTFLPQ